MGAVLSSLVNKVVVEGPFYPIVVDVYDLVVPWHVVYPSFLLARLVRLPFIPWHVDMGTVCHLLVLI